VTLSAAPEVSVGADQLAVHVRFSVPVDGFHSHAVMVNGGTVQVRESDRPRQPACSPRSLF
jgi:hypothetical protein